MHVLILGTCLGIVYSWASSAEENKEKAEL